MRAPAILALAAALLMAAPALGVHPQERLADPKLEARAEAIGTELRCLVCQNESIEDSDADLARDLRLLVRQRLVLGDSDAAVKRYIVARYGTYVLLAPPFQASTYLLWLGPALLLVMAGYGGWRFVRRQADMPAAPASLSADEQARLTALLGEEEAR